MDFATKMENDKRENTYIDPAAGKVSLRRYVDDWLTGSVVGAGTWESYERIMRLHVVPHLGRKTISQVTAADVEALYSRWTRDGAKPNTVESRSIALSALFSHAVRHKRISGNPVKEAEKLENKVIPVDERNLPSLEEIQAIASSIGPRLEPAVWLMACCGLRIGESLGVFPEDFREGVLRVRRQIVRYQGPDRRYVARYAPLKHRSEGEWRDVPVPESLSVLLRGFPSSIMSVGRRIRDLCVIRGTVRSSGSDFPLTHRTIFGINGRP
ncbi:tyrosine-type recombinase/integrase [Streptomyces sp. RTd22]|uniref:tyrosine-type recombinase/integrase n=1 Tax=Streptomyces sp. RTd22 TaxID=1841249 RepID=UPI000A40D814|nr:site-specific integrase [Streptomyces sp. RTd22]